MKDSKKLALAIAILFVLVFAGRSVVYWLNPNMRTHYKLYQENNQFYYLDYSPRRIYLTDDQKRWVTFSDGVALIHEYETHWGAVSVGLDVWKYIDKNGNVVLQPQVYRADSFSEGLAAVIPREGQLWGYMDQTGTIVIEPQYLEASRFKDGVASVLVGDGNEGTWFLINEEGEPLRELEGPFR